VNSEQLVESMDFNTEAVVGTSFLLQAV